MDRYNKNSNVVIDDYLALNVLQKDAVEVKPESSLAITDLNKGSNNKRYKHFYNTGDAGITFKISVLVGKDDTWNGEKVTDVLNSWYVNTTVVRVVGEAIDVPAGEYIITKNPSRKQSFKDNTQWELEFTTFIALNIYRFSNDNANVLKALKKAKSIKNKSSKKKKTTKNKPAYKAKLKKCNYKVLVYSKTKKTVKCVKYMQTVLYKNSYLTKKQVDGWFGPKTKEALKKFQKKHKKKYKLTVNGKVDKSTFKALYS